MALSSLDDESAEPTPARLTRVLGASEEAWHALVSRVTAAHGPVSSHWTFTGVKYGWSCRLRRGKRTILYLIPQEGCFLVGIVLGDRALSLLRREELDPDVLARIDDAPRYGEGTGFRVPVTTVADCPQIEVIVEAKMA